MFWWILFLVMLCAVFVVLHIWLLPKYFLKFKYDINDISARGIKRIQDKRGVSLIYEPDAQTRPYISGYILSERGGKKFAVCQTENSIRFLDYDILLFNGAGKLYRVLNIKEKLVREGMTDEIELPQKTSFALIHVNAADGIKSGNRKPYRISSLWLSLFIALCLLVETLGFFAVRACIAYGFGGIFAEKYLIYSFNLIYEIVGLAMLVIIVNLLLMFIVIKYTNRKIITRGENHAGK